MSVDREWAYTFTLTVPVALVGNAFGSATVNVPAWLAPVPEPLNVRPEMAPLVLAAAAVPLLEPITPLSPVPVKASVAPPVVLELATV